jgi:hypothetical protein
MLPAVLVFSAGSKWIFHMGWAALRLDRLGRHPAAASPPPPPASPKTYQGLPNLGVDDVLGAVGVTSGRRRG